jgi:hypothetical protein
MWVMEIKKWDQYHHYKLDKVSLDHKLIKEWWNHNHNKISKLGI